MAAASGSRRGGYVDHFEASSLLLEASVEPFIERLRVLAEAGHSAVAAPIGAGSRDGLELVEARRSPRCSSEHPDDEWGESVRAIIELADGHLHQTSSPPKLVDFCSERLARFKRVRSVVFRAPLPRIGAASS